MAQLDPTGADRPMKQALWRGWRRRCPACGDGPLLYKYLKVHDHCPNCGEALHHQRADDGPAYLTILVVGHILAPTMLLVWELWRPAPIVMATSLSALTVLLALYLLPRLKGGLIGVQWSRRMHGFDDA